jgi:hypothetical protein
MRTLTYRDLISHSMSELVTHFHHLWLAEARQG